MQAFLLGAENAPVASEARSHGNSDLKDRADGAPQVSEFSLGQATSTDVEGESQFASLMPESHNPERPNARLGLSEAVLVPRGSDSLPKPPDVSWKPRADSSAEPLTREIMPEASPVSPSVEDDPTDLQRSNSEVVENTRPQRAMSAAETTGNGAPNELGTRFRSQPMPQEDGPIRMSQGVGVSLPRDLAEVQKDRSGPSLADEHCPDAIVARIAAKGTGLVTDATIVRPETTSSDIACRANSVFPQTDLSTQIRSDASGSEALAGGPRLNRPDHDTAMPTRIPPDKEPGLHEQLVTAKSVAKDDGTKGRYLTPSTEPALPAAPDQSTATLDASHPTGKPSPVLMRGDGNWGCDHAGGVVRPAELQPASKGKPDQQGRKCDFTSKTVTITPVKTEIAAQATLQPPHREAVQLFLELTPGQVRTSFEAAPIVNHDSTFTASPIGSETPKRFAEGSSRQIVLARGASAQIAAAARQPQNGTMEIRLSPEELGRVKLSMVPGETGLVVHMVVERGETLDLLRRHVELLATELQDAGYEGLEFSFRREDEPGPIIADGDVDSDVAEELEANGHARLVRPTGLPVGASGGVDIRL